MKLLVEPLGGRRRAALIAAAVTFATLALLAIAARAHASETIYWDNYSDNPATIGAANIDGTGGGLLNLGGLAFETTEGMTYDPVTNRLYIAAEDSATGDGEIVYVNVDGSGAGVLFAPGAEAAAPEGIALDPSTRKIYWINTKTDTISWARLDGSGGGNLPTTGAATENIGYRLTIDPASGRLYFSAQQGGKYVISYVNVNGTGGGVLAAAVDSLGRLNGLATDPVSGQLYLLGSSGTLASVGLNGGIVAPVALGSAFDEGYGLAIDPVLQKAYWGNYGQGKTQTNAFGFVASSGGGEGTISPTTTPVYGAQDPVILKSPTGVGAPQVTQSGTALSCSQGSWSADYPGGNVFSAPVSYAYQWLLNGGPVSGATASSYTATATGSYACTVTGSNPSGSASQTSAAVSVTIAALPVPVTPSSVTFVPASKKAVRTKAGKVAIVPIKLTNGGGTASGVVKVCGKLTKKAKKGLVAPKCVSVASIPAGGTVTAKLRVKTRKTAKGLYKFPVVVSGATTGSTTVKVKVIPAKGKKKHHR